MKNIKYFIPFSAFLSFLLFTACGGGSSTSSTSSTTPTSVSLSSISELPDMENVVSNSSSSSSLNAFNISSDQGFAVVGTPNAFTTYDADAFFDTLDTDLDSLDGDAVNTYVNNFFNQMGVCQVMQMTSQVALNMQNASLCYMRNMPTLGVYSLTDGTAASPTNPEDAFAIEATDKTVKVQISGFTDLSEDEPEELDSSDIYIIVKGTNNLESGQTANISFVECLQNGTLFGVENYVFTSGSQASMTYNARRNESFRDGQSWSNNLTVTAALTLDSSGNPIIDPNGVRTLDMSQSFSGTFSHNGQEFSSNELMKVIMGVNSDTMEMAAINRRTGDDGAEVNHLFTSHNYTATSLADTAFLSGDAAFYMKSLNNEGSDQLGQDAIAFGYEYNENATPVYQSTDASSTFETLKSDIDDGTVSFTVGDLSMDYTQTVSVDTSLDDYATSLGFAGCSSVSPSYTVTVDMGEQPQALLDLCETDWERQEICNEAWTKFDSIAQLIGQGGGNQNLYDCSSDSDCTAISGAACHIPSGKCSISSCSTNSDCAALNTYGQENGYDANFTCNPDNNVCQELN